MNSCSLREVKARNRDECLRKCNKGNCISIWEEEEKPSYPDRYFYVFDEYTWDEAKEFCENNNSRLAVIETWQDHQELREITLGNRDSKMLSRIGDNLISLPDATSDAMALLSQGAAVAFADTVWTGLHGVKSESDFDYEYVWNDADDVLNTREGGSPFPNAYNWGWSNQFIMHDSRQFDDEKLCGVMKRTMWNRERCDAKLPFVCEKLGRCQVCDGEGVDAFQFKISNSSGKESSVNGAKNVNHQNIEEKTGENIEENIEENMEENNVQDQKQDFSKPVIYAVAGMTVFLVLMFVMRKVFA